MADRIGTNRDDERVRTNLNPTRGDTGRGDTDVPPDEQGISNRPGDDDDEFETDDEDDQDTDDADDETEPS